jgi:hypothetical protein
MERTLSLRSILLTSAGVLTGALLFAGPAEAGVVTATPTVQGAGTVTTGGYTCTLLLPAGAVPKNTDTTTCGPAVAASVPIVNPITGSVFHLPGTLVLAAQPAAGWRFMGWTGCTPQEGGENGAACVSVVRAPNYAIAPKAIFREIVPVTISAAPGEFTNAKRPSFTFSAAGADSFTCAIDVTPVACGPGTGGTASLTAPTDLADGPHKLFVRATKNTNVSIDAAVAEFTVDTAAPVVALDPGVGPGEGALQAVNVETFEFGAGEPATFECALDGAAFAPCDSGVRFERLTAGAHRFSVRAVDRAGNVGAVAVRNWTVAASDDDGDGFNARVDCNDGNAGIHPGAADAAGNGVDENCDGADASSGSGPVIVRSGAPEQVVVTLAFFSTASKKTTKFSTLQVKNVPLGATVSVTCRGRGCPSGLKGRGFVKKNAFGTVTLAKFIKKPLRAGDAITVVVSKPDAINAVKVLTVRASKKPLITTRCLPPGVVKPVAC